MLPYKHITASWYIAAFLVLLISWCITSSIVWSGVRRIQYASQRMNEHPGKYKDTIILDNQTANHITWIEDDEIRYRGRMFDIKKSIHSGNRTLYIGHYDEKDDKLFKWLHALFDEEQTDGGQNNNPQWKIEAMLCSISPGIIFLNAVATKHSTHYLSRYCSGYISSSFHPPCSVLLI